MAGLRMSAEIGEWLTGICLADPDTASEVGAALIAVIDFPQQAGPPLITELSAPPIADPGDLSIAVDAAYEDLLAWLQMLRRQAHETGSQWKTTTRGRITPQGSELLPWTQEEVAAMREREAELTAVTQRGQRKADAFRARKEAAKASGATADLAALLAQADELRREFLGDVAQEDLPRASTAAEGLLELQAGARGADIRILCAFEPAETLTLLAVLHGKETISESRPLAIGLAGELLGEIRADGWPAEMGDGAAADTATFLAKYFPDRISQVTSRAAELAAAVALADLRRRRGLSLAEAARASGLTVREAWKLETKGLHSAQLRDVAAYIRALGGRLELAAKPDDSPPAILV